MKTAPQHKELGSVAEVTSGQPAPQDQSTFSDIGKPFIRAGSLEGLLSGLPEDSLEQISDDKAKQLRMRLFPPGTVVFAKSGMSAKIGRVYRLKTSCYVVSHLAAVTPKNNLDPGYLQRWLEKNPPSRLIPNEAYPSIRLSEISSLKIPLPLLDEQRNIVAILDKSDTVCSKRRECIRLSDELLRSVFMEFFGDPVTNPKGWPKMQIGNICTVLTGNTPSRSNPDYYGDHIEWIKSDNVNTTDHILTVANEYLSKAGMAVGRTVEADSILVTCIAGSRTSIGKVAIADRKVAFNQQINALVPNPGIEYRFLYTTMLLAKKLVQAVSTDGMKGLVSKGRLQKVCLPIPPTSEQQAFSKVFDKIMNLKRRNVQGSKESKLLFNSLIKRAFQGEL